MFECLTSLSPPSCFRNSIPANFNISYDHGDYRERVDKDKKYLEKMDLNALYDDKELTGFA